MTRNNKLFIVFLYLLGLTFVACDNNSNKISTDVVNNPNTAQDINSGKGPKFKFEKEVIDFGKVNQGEKVSCIFKFKNVGKQDLIISSAIGSCGCTVPDYPKKPIIQNEEAQIQVTFDTNGKEGMQSKTITVMANTIPNTIVLTIKADVVVIKKEKE